MMDCKERIRGLNDLLRETGIGGIVIVTRGIRAMDDEDQQRVFSLVRRFNRFSEDNDPHQEHDFGSVDYKGGKYFWKIDYYNKQLQGGSEGPADPDQTTRVLTIMQAYEY